MKTLKDIFNYKEKIKNALIEKGIDMSNVTLDQYASKIDSLQLGKTFNFYKCVSIDESKKTWTGKKAILVEGNYLFEENVTSGLTYSSVKPTIDQVYSDDALILIDKVHNDRLEYSILEVTSSVENPTMEFFEIIPISGKSAVTVDWGDGTVNNKKMHTYSTHGKHEVKIRDCSRFKVSSKMLTGVEQLGSTITNCSYMFSYCSSLTSIPSTLTIPSSVTNCSDMFSYCSSLTSIPETLTIPSSVTDCSYMFSSCTSLTSIPSTLTIPSSVTDCNSMFSGCSKLNANINNIINKKFTSSSINISSCFNNCSKLTGDPDKIKQFLWEDTNKIWTSSGCFINCTSLALDKIPAEWGGTKKDEPTPADTIITVTTDAPGDIVEFNTVTPIQGKNNAIIDWGDGTIDSSLSHEYSTSGNHDVKISNCAEFKACSENYHQYITGVKQLGTSLTTCNEMFKNCKCFIEIGTGVTIPQGVTNCNAMFASCNDLGAIPAGFAIPSSVTTCAWMFSDCSRIQTIPSSLSIPDNVNYCDHMFDNCFGLTSIHDGLTIPSNVDSCADMFTRCQNLLFDINKVITKPFKKPHVEIARCFSFCYKLSGDTDIVKKYLWEDTTREWGSAGCFQNCHPDFIKYIPTAWGGSGEVKPTEPVNKKGLWYFDTSQAYSNGPVLTKIKANPQFWAIQPSQVPSWYKSGGNPIKEAYSNNPNNIDGSVIFCLREYGPFMPISDKETSASGTGHIDIYYAPDTLNSGCEISCSAGTLTVIFN